MKKNVIKSVLVAALCGGASIAMAQETENTKTMRIYDEVYFYDGYAVNNIPADAPDQGCTRLKTYLNTVKLTDEQIDNIGENLTMNVFITAFCDNYDRIGNVNLAFVPKGQESYQVNDDATDVARIEIARYITPFQKWGKDPQTVPYTYDISYLTALLHDSDLRAQYDFWLEFECFNVPYAAWNEVAGCSWKEDVENPDTHEIETVDRHHQETRIGSIDLVTNLTPKADASNCVFVPITIKLPDWRAGNFNNYTPGASDAVGETVKTITFTVPENVADGQLVLITSNHGANSGGEEYNRRWHYIYVDNMDDPILVYKPGRTSCEPFRVYNTQANGIYGWRKRSDASWQASSNWCPGDVIDTHLINLGAFEAGEHTFRISVPEAVFKDKQGMIPLSLYFIGVKEGHLPYPSGVKDVSLSKEQELVKVNLSDNKITVSSDHEVLAIDVMDAQGKLVAASTASNTVSASSLTPGVYLVSVELSNGVIECHKIYRK